MTRTIVTRDPAWIMERVDIDANGCWIWKGWKANGYGQVKHESRAHKAHRVVYETLVGPIPEGLHIDHLCRVTLCVNPAHLEPVTTAENVRRGLLVALKTHCAQGHPWTPENQFRQSTGALCCRVCRNERARAAAAIPAPPRTPPAQCRNGHAYDEANTYYTRAGWFKCRKCRAEAMRRKR